MKLPKFKDIKKWPSDKVLGKKERGLGKFMIKCCDCDTMIDIDDTTAPRSVKKVIKRNLKMRGIALLALERMHPRCKNCHRKFLEKGGKDLTKDEAVKAVE